ncbi:hypothetical protein [Candidatus Erwinia dacicola]|uniref:Decoration domain protein n=1 Tax=Candidatus Erwinia dacicola TaxID=252393 RepID=A0A328TV38_9GAMM|nr:hypothetical protein [Candidatus Erwinia dacicola]RAP72981.1 decoration domain protein [Candidatus Erwinia dacicola]
MINQTWPKYADTDGNVVYAVAATKITQAIDGSGKADFGSGYQAETLSAQFMAVFQPVAGGYIFKSQYGETLYMSKTAFEAKYSIVGQAVTWSSVTGKPASFAPTIGTTATTAMAGNKVPTASERGGVLLQTAIVALTDSSGGTSGGNTVAAVPAATAATTDATAASLTSTNAAITAIKNDFATLSAKYNALLAAVKAAGITA